MADIILDATEFDGTDSNYENAAAAPFWLRFIAALLDTIFIIIAMFAVYMVFYLGFDMKRMPRQAHNQFVVIFFVVWFLVCLFYTLLSYTYKGATFGKRILGLKVVGNNGLPLTFKLVARRSMLAIAMTGMAIFLVFMFENNWQVTWGPLFAWALFILCIAITVMRLVDCIWAAFHKKRLALHDIFAGTKVVKTRT